LGTFAKFVENSKREKTEVIHFDDVDKEKVAQIFAQAKQNNKTSFPEAQALEIFKAYNFPLLKSAHAKSADHATQIANKIIQEIGHETKFAMKIVSQQILHKSDVGGVMLNIETKDIAQKSQELIARVAKNAPEAKLDGVLVMQMAPKNGVEVILGVSKAPGLGTMIMVGMGGILVEVLKDVAFGYVPLTKSDITKMIYSLKSSQIFEGVRGAKKSDINSLVESIARLAHLVTDFPEIVELDVNPLLVLSEGEGVKVLDARIVIN
jgi:acyl-CoA synthetase (NDP forming)